MTRTGCGVKQKCGGLHTSSHHHVSDWNAWIRSFTFSSQSWYF